MHFQQGMCTTLWTPIHLIYKQPHFHSYYSVLTKIPLISLDYSLILVIIIIFSYMVSKKGKS